MSTPVCRCRDLRLISGGTQAAGQTERGNCAPTDCHVPGQDETEARRLPEIGKHFGGMHHTTVMHAIAKIHHQRSTTLTTDLIVSKLIRALRRG